MEWLWYGMYVRVQKLTEGSEQQQVLDGSWWPHLMGEYRVMGYVENVIQYQ